MSCFVGCVQGNHDRVVVEAFAEGGKEFTAVVVDVGSKYQSRPVTLLPTEVLFPLVSIMSNVVSSFL